MLKKDVQIGSTYDAKVSGQRVEVRIDGEHTYGGWEATNLSTGRKVRIKSAARLSSRSRRDRAANGDTIAAVLRVGGDINDPNEGPAALRERFRFR